MAPLSMGNKLSQRWLAPVSAAFLMLLAMQCYGFYQTYTYDNTPGYLRALTEIPIVLWAVVSYVGLFTPLGLLFGKESVAFMFVSIGIIFLLFDVVIFLPLVAYLTTRLAIFLYVFTTLGALYGISFVAFL